MLSKRSVPDRSRAPLCVHFPGRWTAMGRLAKQRRVLGRILCLGGQPRVVSPQVFRAHIRRGPDLLYRGCGNLPPFGIDRSKACGDSRTRVCRNLRAGFSRARAHGGRAISDTNMGGLSRSERSELRRCLSWRFLSGRWSRIPAAAESARLIRKRPVDSVRFSL